MRKIKLEEVNNSLIVECYLCKMTMPYMSAVTDGKNIYCGSCAGDIEENESRI